MQTLVLHWSVLEDLTSFGIHKEIPFTVYEFFYKPFTSELHNVMDN